MNFVYGSEYLPLSDELRERMRADLEDLQVIIMDEMSMISADMLYNIHSRLCEIFVSEDPFAGKAILLVGDLLQLQPVQATFIFKKPKNPKYHPLHQVESLWKMCKPIILDTNFRQGENSKFSSILNRARVGKMTDEDMKILEKHRLNPNTDKKIISEAFHVFWTNEEVEKYNTKKLNELSTPLEEMKAKIIAPRGYIPKTSKAGTVDKTQFKKNLQLKIGAKVMLTFNIMIGDSLINGQLGKIVDFVKSNGSVIVVMVEFDNKDVGIVQRESNKHLRNEKYPNATPIFKTSFEYRPRKGSGRAHGCKIKVTQFALRLSWASTCHKIQGITIPETHKLVAHGHPNMPAAMQYVMMGRVTRLEDLYISENFDFKKVRCVRDAMKEQLRLEELFSQEITKEYDFYFVNIRSLRKHHEDIVKNVNAQNSKMICLVETWMHTDEENSGLIDIPSREKHLSSAGKGKGCCIYYNNETKILKNVKSVSSDKFQIICGFYNSSIQVFIMYLSKEAQLKNVVEKLENWMTKGPKIIIGDFNYESTKSNILSKFLHSQGLIQIVNRPTHTEGGIIDHCYVNSEWKNQIEIDYIFPYYSDHCGFCISLPQI